MATTNPFSDSQVATALQESMRQGFTLDQSLQGATTKFGIGADQLTRAQGLINTATNPTNPPKTYTDAQVAQGLREATTGQGFSIDDAMTGAQQKFGVSAEQLARARALYDAPMTPGTRDARLSNAGVLDAYAVGYFDKLDPNGSPLRDASGQAGVLAQSNLYDINSLGQIVPTDYGRQLLGRLGISDVRELEGIWEKYQTGYRALANQLGANPDAAAYATRGNALNSVSSGYRDADSARDEYERATYYADEDRNPVKQYDDLLAFARGEAPPPPRPLGWTEEEWERRVLSQYRDNPQLAQQRRDEVAKEFSENRPSSTAPRDWGAARTAAAAYTSALAYNNSAYRDGPPLPLPDLNQMDDRTLSLLGKKRDELGRLVEMNQQEYADVQAAARAAQSGGQGGQSAVGASGGLIAAGGGVNPATETAAGQLNTILANDSPLMQRARAQAMQGMNARGLLNSSMAQEAGVAAMIDRATPIAQQDANTYANRSMQFNDQAFSAKESALNRAFQSSENTLNREFQSSENALNRRFQAAESNAERNWRTSEANLGRTWEATQQQINRDFQTTMNRVGFEQQKELAKFTSELNKANIAPTAAADVAASLNSQINAITLDPNLSPEQKTNAVTSAINAANDRIVFYSKLYNTPLPKIGGG